MKRFHKNIGQSHEGATDMAEQEIALEKLVLVVLPFAVFVHKFGDTGRINRQGRLVPNRTKRYFATKEEAFNFCGDERRVLFRPEDGAWCEKRESVRGLAGHQNKN